MFCADSLQKSWQDSWWKISGHGFQKLTGIRVHWVYLYFCCCMKSIVGIYKRNIYGVMGTLLFHIFLVGVFILAEMDIKREMQEDAILIDFPLEEMEEPVLEEKTETPENQNVQQAGSRSNIPSSANPVNNRSSARERFFDESYEQEIENARKLVSDVNQQLAKDIPDLSKIRMPEQVTEGMDPDSIKNIVYSGDSNIEYDLANRYHLRLPIPIYLAKGGGTVIVDITVNRQGRVVSAAPRRNGSVNDPLIIMYAEAAAQRTLFNNDPSAPASQKGTIRYTFVAQ